MAVLIHGAVRRVQRPQAQRAAVGKGRVAAVLHEPAPAVVEVDLAGVTFLDCTGIGALVGVRNAAMGNAAVRNAAVRNAAGRQLRVTTHLSIEETTTRVRIPAISNRDPESQPRSTQVQNR